MNVVKINNGSDELLDIIKNENNMYSDSEVKEAILRYNKAIYPEPTYIGHNELLDLYPGLLNWRKIKLWFNDGLVRYETRKLLYKTTIEYDPNNPEHKDRKLIDTIFYAKEDFQLLVDRDQVKKNKVKLIHDVFQTNKGKKGLLRDFRKERPDLNEINNLSDSYATFIGWLAMEKIKSEASKKLTQDEQIKFFEILESAIQENTTVN